jgi:hypothetical protein
MPRDRRRGNRSLSFPLGGAVNVAATQSFGERKCYGYMILLWRHIRRKKRYKNEAVPVTGLGGRKIVRCQGSPYCLDSRLTDGGEVVSLTLRPLLQKDLLVLISVSG